MYSTQENVSVTVESIYYSTLIRACTGFDRDSEDGEAIRRPMRQIANLKLNANDNFELAAA